MNESHHRLALPQGTRIQDFEFHRVLGQGGFGITYLGWNMTLDIPVAIKEYLPSDLATRESDMSVVPQSSQAASDFAWGLDRFLDEARTLARFDHRHIIKVHHFFQAHGTAYIVMEYAEGETLSEFLKRRGPLREEELKAILHPILDGLEVVHQADFLHRDIKPGNIIIRDQDDSPVLLDFGAARQAIGTRSRSVTSIITPGYAPIEQYSSRGDQGPWTDIYALGAVCYHALTGQVPEDATERVVHDALMPVVEQCAGQARGEFLSAIDRALQVHKANRPQNTAEWRVALGTGSGVTIPPTGPPPTPPSKEQDREDVDVPPVHQRLDDRSESPKKSKGKLFATIACLLAVLIGGVSYYHYEYVPNQRLKAQEAAEAEVASEQSDRVSALLSGAEEDLSRDRLTSPSGANAWEKYQAVLSLEPGHKIASAGLDSIIGRYVSKFDTSLRSKDFDDAEGYVSRIQSVYTDAPVLSELEDRLSVAREAERQRQADEAERARQAAEAERQRQAKVAEYEGKFEEALSRNDLDMADRYVDSLRAVNVDGTVLSELEGRLSRAREAERRRQEAEAERARQAAAEADPPPVGKRFRDCAECPEMVVVPSGSFMMGSPSSEKDRVDDEGPRHRVHIGYPLAVGIYEVTFSEWEACVNAGGCGGYRPDDRGWGRGNRPVIYVSWEEAQSYVRWLSQRTGHRYSLLSESEWEYVARAGTTTPFYFGSTISTDQANYDGDYTYGAGRKGLDRGKTLPVGSFSANAWGVHDMHGNVYEWVEDCWNGSYAGAPTDGSAWESGNCDRRVLRGGSWDHEPRSLRSANRNWSTTEDRYIDSGFRVIRRF